MEKWTALNYAYAFKEPARLGAAGFRVWLVDRAHWMQQGGVDEYDDSTTTIDGPGPGSGCAVGADDPGAEAATGQR